MAIIPGNEPSLKCGVSIHFLRDAPYPIMPGIITWFHATVRVAGTKKATHWVTVVAYFGDYFFACGSVSYSAQV